MLQRRKHKKGGRPTKYSPAVAWRICEPVARGCSREAAAALAGISASTLHGWRNQFPEFSEALEKADARFEAERVAAICEAGRKTGNWTANAWLLERKFPQRYGKIDRQMTVTPELARPLPQDYINAISEALGYTGKLIPIDSNGVPLLPGESGSGRESTIDVDALPQD